MTELSTFWKDLPDTSTPLAAGTLNEWGAEIEAVRDETFTARDEAIAAAEQAGAPSDDVITALALNPASSTRSALDDLYRTAVSVSSHGATGDGATDDTAAIDAALAAANTAGRVVYFPPGRYLTQGGHALNRVTVMGPASTGTQPTAGDAGATLLVAGTAQPLFAVEDYVTVSDLTIRYPAQVDQPSAPLVYPPTIQGQGTNSAFLTLERLNVYNAYIFAKFDSCGLASFRDIRCYAIHSCYEFKESAETIDIRGGFYGFGFFNEETMHYGGGGAAGSSFYLRTYSNNSGAWIRIGGDGSSTTPSNFGIDALIMSDNFVFGYKYGVDINGGSLSAATFMGGEFDAVETALITRGFGFVGGVAVDGTRFYGYNFATPSTAGGAVFDLRTQAVQADTNNKGSISIRNVWSGFSRGTFLSVQGTGWRSVSLTDSALNLYGSGTGAGTYYGVYTDSADAVIDVADCIFYDTLATAGGAICIQNALASVVRDCTVVASYQPYAANFNGPHVVNGLTVLTTRATYSLTGTSTNLVTARNLKVDKPNTVAASMAFAENVTVPSYTVAALTTALAVANPGRLVQVSNGTTNKRLAISDGANWRFPDGAVIS